MYTSLCNRVRAYVTRYVFQRICCSFPEEENGAEMNRIEEKGVGLRKSVVSIFPPSPIKWHQTQIILASG